MKNPAILMLLFFLYFGCKAQTEGATLQTIRIGNAIREYYLFKPKLGNKAPLPVVIFLHGGGGMAKKLIKYTGGNQLAQKEGFMAIYPQAIEKSWNVGNTPTYRKTLTLGDDVNFISQLIDHLIANEGADPKNIFITGPSRGGMMCYYLAGLIPEKINAIAPMIATLHYDLMDTFGYQRPVPTLIINGTKDPLIPYEGGPGGIGARKSTEMGRGFMGTEEFVTTISIWNECASSKTEFQFPDKDPNDGCRAIEYKFDGCEEGAATVLVKVINGGHAIPGKGQYLPKKWIGTACQDFDGIEYAWRFFEGLLR